MITPKDYADGLKKVGDTYDQSPLACVPGVSGANLKSRVRAILAGAAARELSRTKRLMLAAAGLVALAIPIVVGAMTAPAPQLLASKAPAFEVVSIKPCTSPPPDTDARRSGGGNGLPSPGRVNLDCVPLVGTNGRIGLIDTAYGRYGDGQLNRYWVAVHIEGAPAWAATERFSIEAKADGPVGVETMRGPMMQRLLEERFHLKAHRETRDVPVYDLTIAPGGSKLKPFEGKCKPVDFTKGGLPAQLEAEGACAIVMRDSIIHAPGETIDDFIKFALVLADRPVVNKTGLAGRFDIHLDLPPDDGAAPIPITSRLAMSLPSQLGLKLTPSKGPGEFLIVDRVERPVADDQVSSAALGPQTGPSNKTKFEVASIKPCDPEPGPPGARVGGGGNGSYSPGRAYLSCFVVKNLVTLAYITNRGSRTDAAKSAADPIYNWPGLAALDPIADRIRGGPSWVYSDKYTIEATAPGLDPSDGRNPDRQAMTGPMLRALLEDRFKLKLHEETEEVPMWALTVAKGGLKIKPMKDGDCTNDRSKGPIVLSQAIKEGIKPTCGTVNGGPNGSNWRFEHGGQDLGVVARMLSGDLGAMVLDRTGVTDRFNILWEYGPDDSTPRAVENMQRFAPGVGPPTAANIFTALEQQLGLRLERIKGPRGYLVIDRIERPTPNAPPATRPGPPRATGPGR